MRDYILKLKKNKNKKSEIRTYFTKTSEGLRERAVRAALANGPRRVPGSASAPVTPLCEEHPRTQTQPAQPVLCREGRWEYRKGRAGMSGNIFCEKQEVRCGL